MSERECSNSSCDKSSCEGCPSREKPANFKVDTNEYSCIRRVIGVVSGKGGVGKSLVTASLANQLAAKGHRVGILDADITGPSIPKMYGVHGPAEATDMGIEPCYTENGIALMSMNLLLPVEETPVIWRGPIIANVVKQFWTDVIWGELDYLLVDMPPGTGDVPLTVFQSLPVDEIVVVTSPQDLVQLIVKKALNMAEQMHIPVKGIVENYSYFKCPDCGKEIKIYGDSHIDEEAEKLGLKVLGKVPVEPSYAEAADRGEFHKVVNVYIDWSR
ncbi:MAG: Mrp/NBP35 family ATP-binding protein [Lachnospiraceae bacterium]|jgi:Mrp family chromosome partitioning ATPase|nr:Mrp/NBP35 family ATP-binding protein [Lachnospiraceae bacterium]